MITKTKFLAFNFHARRGCDVFEFVLESVFDFVGIWNLKKSFREVLDGAVSILQGNL